MVMNETELRMIKEMLNKQKELVSETMKEFGLTTIEEEQLSQALLCEVGEFISETKQDWCWWMKNPPANSYWFLLLLLLTGSYKSDRSEEEHEEDF